MKSSTIFQIYSLLKAGINRLGKPNPFVSPVNWMPTKRKAEFDKIHEYFKYMLPNASDIDILKVTYEIQLQKEEIELQKQLNLKEKGKEMQIKEIEFEIERQKLNFSCTENYYLKLLSTVTQRYVSLF